MFNPDSAAPQASGIYGLPFTEDQARVVLLPVPFDATTSYRAGAAKGPAAILQASRQVELHDLRFGRPWEGGLVLRDEDPQISAWNREARALAEPVIAAGGVGQDAGLRQRAARVNAIGDQLNAWVYAETRALLERGCTVGLVGGDHAVPFGAMKAHAERWPGLGILHVDAHADLRCAYEGFTWSHASILYNVCEHLPGVARVVQVGIRDVGEEELTRIEASSGRIQTFFDTRLAEERFRGERWAVQVDRIVEALPPVVYVSFDIDGLDPALCPHTGTPVPGGLSWNEAIYLLQRVAAARRVVGFDLVEVAPGPEGDEWDGNVGARLLYALVGCTVAGARKMEMR